MLRASEPFCDFLSVSFPETPSLPEDDAIVPDVLRMLEPCGCNQLAENIWEVGAYHGTVKVFERQRVRVLSFSGGALRALRESALLRDIVLKLSEVPHRVTRLDASCDYLVDAPPVIERYYRLVRRGSVAVGSKVVRAKDMTVYFGAALDGRRTGTLYLGGPKAEIRVCIYDKRHERLCKGAADPGPLLRVEVRSRSQVGCSVYDALYPEALFYHYAAPGLVLPPAPVRPWGPYGAGFKLPAQPAKYTPAQRLKWLIEDSAVVAEMFVLVRKLEPGGLDYLFTQLRRRYEARARPGPGSVPPDRVRPSRSGR
jgi:hypothetical protein